MGAYFKNLLFILASAFKSQGQLAAENDALLTQILVFKRKQRGRIRLRNFDRVILGWLSQVGPGVADAIIIMKPETVLRWHRLGFRAFYRWQKIHRSSDSFSVAAMPSGFPHLAGLHHECARPD